MGGWEKMGIPGGVSGSAAGPPNGAFEDPPPRVRAPRRRRRVTSFAHRGRANRRVCLQLLVEQVRAVEMAVAGHEVEAAKVAAEAAEAAGGGGGEGGCG